MEWTSVVDSAVKIGLGAAIAAIASYVMLRRTQHHEVDKDKVQHQRTLIERKRTLYLEFLAASGMLTQKYVRTVCTFDGEDYFAYLRLHHEVQISAGEAIRDEAVLVLRAVNDFITLNKAPVDYEAYVEKKKKVSEEVGVFEHLVREELDSLMRVQ